METGLSERTLYRDIESWRVAGDLIDGEARYGYSLVEDFALPLQMFYCPRVEVPVVGLAEERQSRPGTCCLRRAIGASWPRG
ncbi:MAG: hypothetical protein KDK03_06420 [Rhodobacteraceae bacterium]|nr:hypothetical protein [Paracoccaceae bacterium]